MSIFRIIKNSGITAHAIVWHFLFWFTYLLIRITIIQLYPGSFSFRLQMELIELPLKLFVLYVAIYYLIKTLLIQKRYRKFIFVLFGFFLTVMLLNRIEDVFIIYPLTGSEYTRAGEGFWNIRSAFKNLIYLYPVLGIGGALYFIKSWFDGQRAKDVLAKEKAEAELETLKAQLHPHFLLNTLNNIYSLTQTNSAKGSEMMLNLSKLLRYMLYQCDSDRILLENEINCLKDYVELEQIRFGDRLDMMFMTSGEIQNIKIAPLILFPLLENCFKHGAHSISGMTWIRFNLHVQSNILVAQFENAIPDVSRKKSRDSGIGLSNVRKRLELIYGGRHELRVYNEDTYLVKLKLHLHD